MASLVLMTPTRRKPTGPGWWWMRNARRPWYEWELVPVIHKCGVLGVFRGLFVLLTDKRMFQKTEWSDRPIAETEVLKLPTTCVSYKTGGAG